MGKEIEVGEQVGSVEAVEFGLCFEDVYEEGEREKRRQIPWAFSALYRSEFAECPRFYLHFHVRGDAGSSSPGAGGRGKVAGKGMRSPGVVRSTAAVPPVPRCRVGG